MIAPLTGIRILDLTHVWAGPLATRILADLGAEVIKVEAATARGPRQRPPRGVGLYPHGEPGDEPWNRQGMFNKLNRNKKSLSIDLKSDAGRELLLGLVAESDVIVENFSARTMPRLGLGYEALREVNPRLIYLAMPGFGTSGPDRDFVAYGPSVEPMTGLTSIMGYGPDEPRMSAMALPDACTGVSAAAAIVTGLARRSERREGGFIDLSLQEAAIALFGEHVLERQLSGREPPVRGNAHPDFAPHGVYPCTGEDDWIVMAARDEREWAALCRLAGRGWERDSRFATSEGRREERRALDAEIAQWSRGFDKRQLMEELQAQGLPAGAVLNAPELLSDPHLEARGFFVELGAAHIEPFPYPGLPLRFHETVAEPGEEPRWERWEEHWTAAPRLGEHNEAVLQELLGLDPAEIARLAERGVLANAPPYAGRGPAWPV